MHARVVRFTGVTPERISEIVARIEDEDGPPPGVDPVGFELFVDGAQGTALLRWLLRNGGEDARGERGVRADGLLRETPGSRASVDLCEDQSAAEVQLGHHVASHLVVPEPDQARRAPLTGTAGRGHALVQRELGKGDGGEDAAEDRRRR